MGTVIDTTYYPTEPILIGADWGAGSGHKFTFSQDISSVVFSLTFENNGTEIIQLTEANGRITHSGAYIIYLKISHTDTATLSPSIAIGNLLGTSGTDVNKYMTINTEIIR